MKQTAFSVFLDRSFYFIMLVILNILIINSIFNKARTFSLIVGSILGTLIFLVLLQYLNSKSKIKSLQKDEQSRLQKTFDSLSVSNPNEIRQFLSNSFSANSKFSVSTIDDILLIQNNDTHNSFALDFDFLADTAKLSDIFKFLNIAKNTNAQNFIFLANSFPINAIEISNNNPNLILYDKVDTFNLFKALNAFPTIKEETSKRNRKEELKQVFSKINIRKFLSISILLLIISFFTPLKMYYRICAGISFMFFILCIIFKPKEQKPKKLHTPEHIINL